MRVDADVATAGFGAFFAVLLGIIAPAVPRLFWGRYGRRHRLFGAAYLAWLLVGFADVAAPTGTFSRVAFDVVLSLLGLALTLSAAFDFRRHHEAVRNAASGALEPDATVTFSEMIEHAFYQWLNLFQIGFLHLVTAPPPSLAPLGLRARLALATLATSPWLVRDRFPVNRFSDNYSTDKASKGARTLVAVLYRLKKYQYLLYKHVLLHGLNVTVAFRGAPSGERLARGELPLTAHPSFRLYWLALNTAYTHEFFLQTLVKRRILRQRTMLLLNQLLMAVSTLAAARVVGHVHLALAACSLLLNLAHRSRPFGEIANFLLVMALGAAVVERA
ncbi:hypothetical protein KFE25_009210 [Diacronema lutheri]|uniref:Uncharacterized protein n=2 Tax=Diacronema lutheri TaxID=2081491 RepID=A0A8J5XUF0_DIALT|nr:hypothetical protein KFE25_009210 [Diacronema lutheri]